MSPRKIRRRSYAGGGAETYVLVTGSIGGVAGYHRLERLLLAHGKRVLVIDPYQLSLDSADVSFAAMARRAERVIADRQIGDAYVVGHSWGGGVALRIAADMPERVRALYLLDAGAMACICSPIMSTGLRLAPLIARMPGARHVIRVKIIAGLRDNSARAEWIDDAAEHAYADPIADHFARVASMALRLSRAAEPETLDVVLARVRAPITVILGGVTTDAGPSAAELTALQRVGDQAHIERLPGVGHFPHEEAPDEVARRVLTSRPLVVARASGGLAR